MPMAVQGLPQVDIAQVAMYPVTDARAGTPPWWRWVLVVVMEGFLGIH